MGRAAPLPSGEVATRRTEGPCGLPACAGPARSTAQSRGLSPGERGDAASGEQFNRVPCETSCSPIRRSRRSMPVAARSLSRTDEGSGRPVGHASASKGCRASGASDGRPGRNRTASAPAQAGQRGLPGVKQYWWPIRAQRSFVKTVHVRACTDQNRQIRLADHIRQAGGPDVPSPSDRKRRARRPSVGL